MFCPSSLVAQAVVLPYVSNMSHFVPRVWPPTILRVLSGHWQEDHSREICQDRGVPVAREHPEQRETYLRRHHDQRIVDFNCGPLLCGRGVSTREKWGQPRPMGLVTSLLVGIGYVCPWGLVQHICGWARKRALNTGCVFFGENRPIFDQR